MLIITANDFGLTFVSIGLKQSPFRLNLMNRWALQAASVGCGHGSTVVLSSS